MSTITLGRLQQHYLPTIRQGKEKAPVSELSQPVLIPWKDESGNPEISLLVRNDVPIKDGVRLECEVYLGENTGVENPKATPIGGRLVIRAPENTLVYQRLKVYQCPQESFEDLGITRHDLLAPVLVIENPETEGRVLVYETGLAGCSFIVDHPLLGLGKHELQNISPYSRDEWTLAIDLRDPIPVATPLSISKIDPSDSCEATTALRLPLED